MFPFHKRPGTAGQLYLVRLFAKNEDFLNGAPYCDLLIYWHKEIRLKIKAY